MKKAIAMVLLLQACFYAQAQTKPKVAVKPVAAKPPFKNLLDSFSYAIGYNIANNIKSQGVKQLNVAMLQRAFDDVYKQKPVLLTPEQGNMIIQKQIQIFTEAAAKPELAKGRAFLEANKKRPGVITLPNGLQYEILKKSDSGAIHPRAVDTVVVNYKGTLVDGRPVDESKGSPVTFKLTEVIPGWTEIIQLMVVGDKWKVFIPTELGYYMNPRDPNVTPPGAALIFEISLEGIKPVVN